MVTPINRCDKAVNTLNMYDVAVNTDAEEASSKRCSACFWKIPAIDAVKIISAEELRDKSLDGLTNVCDKAVSVLRNTVTSLGKVLKEQKFHPLQFKEVFAVPIQNLEVGKLKLENLLIDIRTQYHDIYFEDDRYFCNTYLKVRDLKDWGYRFVDYASATVALAMIVVEAAKAQNPQTEQSSMIQHWGITGGFLVLSKVLSAATDYRSKKTFEKEQRKNTLLHLKYRCDKAKEAAAIIDVLKAFTRSIDEIDLIELKMQLKRSIRAIKEENGGVVSRSTAKMLKKELGSLMEEKIFQDAGSDAVLHYKYEMRVMKRIFTAWNQQRFEIDETRAGADLSALQEEGHTIVEVTETGRVKDPRLKEIFREWNYRRAEAESAAGVSGFLPEDQIGQLTEEDRGGTGKEIEAVVVDIVPFEHEEGRNISANLQYGAGKEAKVLTLPLSTSALAGQSNNPYLSPPNLFATMSRNLETNV